MIEESSKIYWEFCEYIDAGAAYAVEDGKECIYIQVFQQKTEQHSILSFYQENAKKMAVSILKTLAGTGDQEAAQCIEILED